MENDLQWEDELEGIRKWKQDTPSRFTIQQIYHAFQTVSGHLQ